MTKKTLNISEEAAVQMPMKTVASLIILVSMGVFAYTEITARLTTLETSRELFQAEDGIRDFCLSRGLGDVYKRQF